MTLPTNVFSSQSMHGLDLWRSLTNLPTKVHLVKGTKQHFHFHHLSQKFDSHKDNYNGKNFTMIPPSWVTELYFMMDWMSLFASFSNFSIFKVHQGWWNLASLTSNLLQQIFAWHTLECSLDLIVLTWNIVHKLNRLRNSELHLCFMGDN